MPTHQPPPQSRPQPKPGVTSARTPGIHPYITPTLPTTFTPSLPRYTTTLTRIEMGLICDCCNTTFRTTGGEHQYGCKFKPCDRTRCRKCWAYCLERKCGVAEGCGIWSKGLGGRLDYVWDGGKGKTPNGLKNNGIWAKMQNKLLCLSTKTTFRYINWSRGVVVITSALQGKRGRSPVQTRPRSIFCFSSVHFPSLFLLISRSVSGNLKLTKSSTYLISTRILRSCRSQSLIFHFFTSAFKWSLSPCRMYR